MPRLKPFLLFILIYLVLACSSSDTLPVLTFNVVDSLLQKSVADSTLNIEYAVPLNWKLLSPDSSALIQAALLDSQQQNSEFKLKVQKIYYASDVHSLLTVCQLPEISETAKFETVAQSFTDALNADVNKPMKTGIFLKDNFKILQALKIQENSINFKLLFRNNAGKYIQFDYVLSMNYYKDHVTNIESSIGSIHLIN